MYSERVIMMDTSITETVTHGNTHPVIYLSGNAAHNRAMDAKTARTENIRQLVSRLGGPTAFVARFGDAGPARSTWSQAQVSQWTSADRPKGIGHALAREIERRLALTPGWMDQPHTSDASASPATGLTVREPDLVEQLLTLASPRTQRVIQRIAKAAESGVLSEADVSLLGEIADRLIKPKP